jgi:hypothetical protein
MKETNQNTWPETRPEKHEERISWVAGRNTKNL